jgi:hypothetical protein
VISKLLKGSLGISADALRPAWATTPPATEWPVVGAAEWANTVAIARITPTVAAAKAAPILNTELFGTLVLLKFELMLS